MRDVEKELALMAPEVEFSKELAENPRKLQFLVEVAGELLGQLVNKDKYPISPTDIKFVVYLLKYAVDTWYPDIESNEEEEDGGHT